MATVSVTTSWLHAAATDFRCSGRDTWRLSTQHIRFEGGSMSTLETLELRFDYRSTHATEWSIVGMEQLTNLKKVTLDGNKDNPALIHAVELLRADGSGGGRLSTRSKNNEFHACSEISVIVSISVASFSA
ncbi:unnamed protein product [Miscanthus lutarioriparius]|uniref:Uncharacterized protein n=1 Tax=Miscanthus lutarioriparius TaxID=422564 RepID=A0A811NBG9_9POAL|nr:unnamed protein product [Miscanthus lutarioriparius]